MLYRANNSAVALTLFGRGRRTEGALFVATRAIVPHFVTMTTVHRLVLEHARDVFVVVVGQRSVLQRRTESGVARSVSRSVLKHATKIQGF